METDHYSGGSRIFSSMLALCRIHSIICTFMLPYRRCCCKHGVHVYTISTLDLAATSTIGCAKSGHPRITCVSFVRANSHCEHGVPISSNCLSF